MTWIASDQLVSLHACPESDHHDAPGTELAPGVRIERRAILWVPALAAASLFFSRPGRALAASPTAGSSVPPSPDFPRGTYTWEEFLKRCVPIAQEQIKDTSPAGQEAYLLAIAAQAIRLDAAPRSPLAAFAKLQPKVEFGPSYRGFPFFIIQWRMEPGAVLPAHCHPNFSVCTLGLEGEARLRNFEIFGDAPAFDSASAKSFLIRETHDQIIAPRRISTLSPARDNIHFFQAGSAGARGIDITTAHGGTGNFSFLAFDANRPRDSQRRLYEAVWTGMKPR